MMGVEFEVDAGGDWAVIHGGVVVGQIFNDGGKWYVKNPDGSCPLQSDWHKSRQAAAKTLVGGGAA